MDKDIRYAAHCAYLLNYHLVWIPRYRKPVLKDQVAVSLRELVDGIALQYHIFVVACEILPDHVHLFVSAPPKYAPADLARLFKGITSRRLMQAFPHLRRVYWGKRATLWAEGYYVGTAGHVSAETIKRYIEESQGK